MGKIYCIIGKSSTGKDTIYKRLLRNKTKRLSRIVPYTTRPIRAGERQGVEYHFTDIATMEKLNAEHKVIECRCYDTMLGPWYYFTVKDNQINLNRKNYLVIATIESFCMMRKYFGKDKVIPIYIEVEDGERLARALKREKNQKEPKYEEVCRRFLADQKDFSETELEKAGIDIYFENYNMKQCIENIMEYINSDSDAK